MNYDDLDYDKPLSIKVWRRMFPYIRNFRRPLILIAVLMVVCSAVDVAYPLLLSFAVDNFVVPGSRDGVTGFSVVIVGFVLIQSFAVFVFIRLGVRVETGFGRLLRKDAFTHVQSLSVSYFNTTPVGYILARVMSDTTRIGDIIAWSLVDLLWSVCYIVGAFIAMFWLDWRLTLIVLAVMPALIAATLIIQKKLLKVTRKVRRQNSLIVGAFNEEMLAAKTTKALRVEELNFGDFSKLTREMYRKSRSVARISAMFLPLIMFVGMISMAMVLSAGGYLVMFEGLKIGTIAAFVSFAVSVFEPIQMIARVYSEFVASSANIERVCALLDREPEITDRPEVAEKYGSNFSPRPENWESLRGDVEFRDVTFRYPDGGENVLEDFNLSVSSGAYVAIVGETGAGKSTLINLVCRFFEPTSGQVLIDGRDIRDRSQLWLHRNIGYVLQSPHLFSGSIKDNIRYGRPEASDEEVMAAARMVSADKVIDRLERGLDTEVGEGGARMSTGEKQLISFARAVLIDPKILILDEATSSVDTETENLIKEATEFMLRGRTAFVIAHRLSTIRSADVIFVVSDGKIIERGSHKELIKKRGRYFDLYTQQYETAVMNRELLGKN